jgi:hypothetical protein
VEEFSAKVGREGILKMKIGNEILHEMGNDNGVRAVNFSTSKILTVEVMLFPRRDIYKYSWTSPDGKTHNQTEHLLIDRGRHSSVLDVRSFRTANCEINRAREILYGEVQCHRSVGIVRSRT